MQLSLIAALVTLLPLTFASPATPIADASLPGSTANVAGLHAVARAAGKLYLGTATDNDELTDTQYTAILEAPNMFGQITAENSMKWDATEPEQGVFTFTEADQIANLATSHGQLLRGHNCVWHQQLPSWVTSGNFDAAQLTSIIQNHCGTLVGRYSGRVWDVVNEPLNDDGSFRSDVFFNTLGESYIPIALRAAKAADPNAKVYINDFNIEGLGAKATAMKNLVQSLKSQGVPIDGIGLQSHFIVGEVPTTLVQNMQEFVALGVEVAITELDIRMTLPETAALLEQQKQDYQTVISACQAVQGCVGITLWDFTDKFSFIPSTFPGQGAACPWDENLVRKPAFDGIVAGF
ncbi:endo-beta-1,4-glucanase [Trametes punicea]|nr:endo-beta-1,4-glucanase [Trametes punicea]